MYRDRMPTEIRTIGIRDLANHCTTEDVLWRERIIVLLLTPCARVNN